MIEGESERLEAYPVMTTSEGPGPRVGHASLLVGNAFIGWFPSSSPFTRWSVSNGRVQFSAVIPSWTKETSWMRLYIFSTHVGPLGHSLALPSTLWC